MCIYPFWEIISRISSLQIKKKGKKAIIGKKIKKTTKSKKF